jgi:hypothetical protein
MRREINVETGEITEHEDVIVILETLPVLTYQQERAPLYPPYTDYLDGIVKGDQAQIQKYIDDCLAVKAQVPKT